jgi:ABC-type lipoprotein export system ATPase subunit
MTSVEVVDLCVSFGQDAARLAALSHVTFRAPRNAVNLIYGASGSGKTTLLTILGGLRRPDSGKVLYGPVDITQLKTNASAKWRQQNVGFVFQSFRLFDTLSAIENVVVPAHIAGLYSRETSKRGCQLLEELGLGHKMHLSPHALSGGERQRVAIARSLLLKPAVILADEPTASLDSSAGEQVRKLFRGIAADPDRSVIVVSHDSAWFPVSDHTIHMKDGRVIDEVQSVA